MQKDESKEILRILKNYKEDFGLIGCAIGGWTTGLGCGLCYLGLKTYEIDPLRFWIGGCIIGVGILLSSYSIKNYTK